MAHSVPKPAAGAAPAPGPLPTPPIPGWVTAPGPSVLCAPGNGGRFIADFDRSQVVDHSDAEAAQRVLRPGTIVLANLDLDAPPSPRPTDVMGVRDSEDDKINGPSDEPGLTTLKLRQQVPCAIAATQLTLRCDPADAKRIRIFQAGLPAGTASKIGPAAGAQIVLPLTGPPAIDYLIEAITLPGDHTLPHPTSAPPAPPDGIAATLPAGAAAGSPLYSTRAPADVWLELEHTAASPFRPARDVALITIAPWLMLPNTRPVTRLYFVYLDGGANHGFAYDLCEAARAIFGSTRVPLDPDEGKLLTPSTPASTDAVYLADGAKYPDVWMQDQLEIGYCWAPHAWMHVALHNRRGGDLEAFVHGEIAAPGFGVYDKLPRPHTDSIDFGGNLEVSPPVANGTREFAVADDGGPSVKAHPPAPFGKIIIGDCAERNANTTFHDFLVAQKVQPVLPMDTSWLRVGHVDEFMSFIPSNNGKDFKLVIASIRAMKVLLEVLTTIPYARGRTNFHAGRWERNHRTRRYDYAEESVEDIQLKYDDYNEKLRKKKLAPAQKRLEQGLDLVASDIIPLPTYFKLPARQAMTFTTDDTRTIAHTVGSVNMQIVNGHLLVPRPFGPRLRPADAKTVVENTMARIGWRKPVRVSASTGFYFWAEPRTSIDFYAASFASPNDRARRDNIVGWMRGGPGLTAANSTLIAAKRTEIQTHANNTSGPNALSVCLDSSGKFTRWKRLFIPHDTVDVLEVYMRSVFEAEGCIVHFIDDWNDYHDQMGEVHCGTNVIRTPPELDAGFTTRWWDNYQPDLDLSYDPNA